MIDSKRVVVTGGAGFIGSSLCCKLIREGKDVLCVDNLYTEKNIAQWLGNVNFEFLRHDTTDTFPVLI
ncbi:hypothetical protein DSCO28_00820 [Desulfosarcina ovata subsp. sediminis]|uniref:NAD-dependent epimerase/dehydratase domain-containing protein n=1 Tax=Desulfosarcina ovata subsp. sediminis TaxID=885957 RepID=A0A5K7ZEZ6_9BACT|nr:NAD-dependent epimerase/dehydratase family protein [Desulfosarcina ovata]BBO79516.1 hypothetical protein DSCO28_00820 [Desulfosarcina ovata subsp. sediminis]